MSSITEDNLAHCHFAIEREGDGAADRDGNGTCRRGDESFKIKYYSTGDSGMSHADAIAISAVGRVTLDPSTLLRALSLPHGSQWVAMWNI